VYQPANATEIDDYPYLPQAKRYTKPTSLLFYQQGYSVQSRYFYPLWFVITIFKDSERVRRPSGHGRNVYVLLRDHLYTFQLLLFAQGSLPSVAHQMACHQVPDPVDLNTDEPWRRTCQCCQEVLDLFTQARCAVEPTAPSHQNGPVRESPSRHLKFDPCHALGASLASRFWPNAFYHFLRLHNMTIW
jgi:hypothetical protein